MPDQPKTKHRTVRLDDDLWQHVEAWAQEIGSDKTAVIRDLLRYWLREPGAKRPQRPAVDTREPKR